MKRKNNFFIGFILGLFVCALVWYWQKSTSSDEGALALLDRLAAAETRIRQLRTESAATVAERRREGKEAPETAVAESAPGDLRTVRGIGPIFADRLREADIDTVERLVATNADELASVLNIGRSRAEAILAEAIDSLNH